MDAGGAGWGLSVTRGALWVQVDPPIDAVVRIDVLSGESVPVVPAGRNSIVVGDTVWVVTGQTLVEVGADGTVRGEVALPGDGGSYIAAGGDRLWVATGAGLVAIDPDTRSIAGEPTPLPSCAAKELAFAFGSAWLACKSPGSVFRIDPDASPVVEIPTRSGAHSFALTDDAVWVTNYRDGSVSRIDPATNEVVATIEGIGEGVGLTAGGGSVWASGSGGIGEIDPATNLVVRVLERPGEFYDLAWTSAGIWATTRGSPVLLFDVSD